jgi:ABC-type Fe3+/spermidine/putrescine transport system ATPase subunit
MTTAIPTDQPVGGVTPAERGKLDVDGVTHRYGSEVALREVSLHVQAGEFVTFLGPSGCGKTTLLRIIAGFIRPSEGRIRLQDEDVTTVPPHKRWTQLVFQRPTLFPHLDVYDNVAFGLRVAKHDRAEIRRRVSWALALVRLEDYGRRRSTELSGGQLQRVAIARALVLQPKVLLLDEPLSALDLKIRLEMESELRQLHREMGATFVYVTHDQREALALSDRIVVFDHGRIEQVGTAEDIYRRPASPFVARFVGNANVLPVDLSAAGAGKAEARLADGRFTVACRDAATGPAWLVLRPEAIRFADMSAPGGEGLPGIVEDVAFRGTGFSYRVAIRGVEHAVNVEISIAAGQPAQLGDEVRLVWDDSACSVLPRDAKA